MNTSYQQIELSIRYQYQTFIAQPGVQNLGELTIQVPCLPKRLTHDAILILQATLDDKQLQPIEVSVDKIIPASLSTAAQLVLITHHADHAAKLWQLNYLLRGHTKMRCATPSVDNYDQQTLPKIPARGIYNETARQTRLTFIKEQTQTTLTQVAQTLLDPTKLVSNVESLIGSVEIPIGVAGPLSIQGDHAQGLFYAPIATSEGALVASITRGASAISQSGGVQARVVYQRMTRVPLFILSNMEAAFFFAEWITDHQTEIKTITEKHSNYAQLITLETQVIGKAVHVHFVYETGDAAGQNMTTACTWQACQWIMQQARYFECIQFENFLIEANLSNDKKVTYHSFIKTRGIRVQAEAHIPTEVAERILKVSPKQLVETYHHVVAGSIAAGMIGININVANVIAAMFTATGQDIACVHESAIAQLHLELTEHNQIYASLVLPSLIVGTVGGGTNLPQQQECLQMLGCAGPGNAHKLAEVIASFCLSVEISTLAAIASDQFARAHEKLGRNRPVNWLKKSDLNNHYFEHAMQTYFAEDLQVSHIIEKSLSEDGSSIITELTAHKINKLAGHFPFDIHFKQDRSPLAVMVKVKPLDSEVILMLNSMASMCAPRLAQEYQRHKNHLGFNQCHTRELAVMAETDPRFTTIAPRVYHAWQDPEREAYVLLQEDISHLTLINTADDTKRWTDQHIKAAIAGIAQFHSLWFDRPQDLLEKPWICDAPNTQNMQQKSRLWEMLGVHAREEFPEWFSDTDLQRFTQLVMNLEQWYPELDDMPKTLIHNDFNPRNIAFRKTAAGLQLCAYDWELATIHVPQRDLVELLAFSLHKNDVSVEKIDEYIEYHRQCLMMATAQDIDPVQWQRGYCLSLYDLTINRLAMYHMAHTFRHYAFMERVHHTTRALFSIENKRAPQ